MTLNSLILRRLAECHLLFPSFNNRTKEDMKIIGRIFSDQLKGYSEQEVNGAFDHWMRTGKTFPVVSDIVDALAKVTCYIFNNGPLGFGGVYHADHPYTRLQMRIPGQDISRYAIEISALDEYRLKIEARNAPAISAPDEDETPAIERSGRGGLRRIGYSVGQK